MSAWRWYRRQPLATQFKVEWAVFCILAVIWIAFCVGLFIGRAGH